MYRKKKSGFCTRPIVQCGEGGDVGVKFDTLWVFSKEVLYPGANGGGEA